MADRVYSDRKVSYYERFSKLLDQYTSVLVVGADNVRSTQMHQIRRSLRGKGLLLMGKNTVMRKVLRAKMKENPKLESLLGCVRENIGFVFVEEGSTLAEVRELCLSHKLAAPAKAGAISPCTVIVPAGPTGMEPTQTAFLQALNIATKIQKGQIEITASVELIKTGDKVGASEAALLSKLNIRPFSYGLVIESVYDNGSIFSPAVLDITKDVINAQFSKALSAVAAISLQLNYPTQASIPHSIGNAFKACVAVVVGLESFTFDEAKPFQAFLADPSAFQTSSGGGDNATTTAATTSAPVVVEEEVDALEGGMDMFGDGGGGDY